jgi:hypothetical protein
MSDTKAQAEDLIARLSGGARSRQVISVPEAEIRNINRNPYHELQWMRGWHV